MSAFCRSEGRDVCRCAARLVDELDTVLGVAVESGGGGRQLFVDIRVAGSYVLGSGRLRALGKLRNFRDFRALRGIREPRKYLKVLKLRVWAVLRSFF